MESQTTTGIGQTILIPLFAMKGETNQCWEAVDNYRFTTMDLLFIQLAKETESPIGLSLQTVAHHDVMPLYFLKEGHFHQVSGDEIP